MKLPRHISLHASPSAVMILSIVYSMASVSLVLANIPVAGRLGLFFVLAISFTLNIYRHALRRAMGSPQKIILGVDEQMALVYRNGDIEDVRVMADSVVLSFCVVLSLRVEGTRRKKRLTICADACDNDDFRILRAWLRWKAVSDTFTDDAVG